MVSRMLTGFTTVARNVSFTLDTRELISASSLRRIRVPAGKRYIESGCPNDVYEFAKIKIERTVIVVTVAKRCINDLHLRVCLRAASAKSISNGRAINTWMHEKRKMPG